MLFSQSVPNFVIFTWLKLQLVHFCTKLLSGDRKDFIIEEQGISIKKPEEALTRTSHLPFWKPHAPSSSSGIQNGKKE